MSKANGLRKRMVCAVLLFVFLMTTSLCALPGKALEPTQTLKVYAQYWGDPDSATLLREFTRDEMNELSYGEYGYEGYYCNVTNVNTVMRIHARGIDLAEFLRHEVGLDLTSVRQLDFHTSDVEADARFLSKGREELLDSARYWYPNLIDHAYVDENGKFQVDDETAAAEGAVQVPTIIAVAQYSTKNPMDDLSGQMTDKDTFRLCEGQPDLTTRTSFESARWVDEIYVVLAGSPPEEPTEPDTPEEPTQPDDEKPTGSDITPAPEEPTDPQPTAAPKPTEKPTAVPSPTASPSPTEAPKPTVAPNPAPQPSASTTNRPGVIRSTRRNTQSTATTVRSTTRLTTTTTRSSTTATSRQIAGENAGNELKMEQLVVNDYDSLIQWKQDPGEEVNPLKKPTVTTKGARNAAILFVASFGAGGFIMYKWFKEEQ